METSSSQPPPHMAKPHEGRPCSTALRHFLEHSSLSSGKKEFLKVLEGA